MIFWNSLRCPGIFGSGMRSWWLDITKSVLCRKKLICFCSTATIAVSGTLTSYHPHCLGSLASVMGGISTIPIGRVIGYCFLFNFWFPTWHFIEHPPTASEPFVARHRCLLPDESRAHYCESTGVFLWKAGEFRSWKRVNENVTIMRLYRWDRCISDVSIRVFRCIGAQFWSVCT